MAGIYIFVNRICIYFYLFIYIIGTADYDLVLIMFVLQSQREGCSSHEEDVGVVMGGDRPPICMMLQDGSSTFSFFSMGASYSLDESRIEGVSGNSPDYDK